MRVLLPPQALVPDLLNTLRDKLALHGSRHAPTYLPRRKVCLAQQSAAGDDLAVLFYRAKPLLPGRVGGEAAYLSTWHPLDLVLHSSLRCCDSAVEIPGDKMKKLNRSSSFTYGWSVPTCLSTPPSLIFTSVSAAASASSHPPLPQGPAQILLARFLVSPSAAPSFNNTFRARTHRCLCCGISKGTAISVCRSSNHQY